MAEAVQNFKLEQDEELRFEVECEESITVELKSGKAEVFGSEMVENCKYKFVSGDKFSIFTYHGCEIEVIKFDILFPFLNCFY